MSNQEPINPEEPGKPKTNENEATTGTGKPEKPEAADNWAAPKNPSDEPSGDEVETGDYYNKDTLIEHRNPYETGEFRGVEMKKPATALYVVVGLLVIAVAAMAYFLFINPAGGGEGDSSAQIRQMKELTGQVRGLESDVKKKEDEIFGLVDEYKKQTGEDSIGSNVLNLTPEEQALAQRRIDNEQNNSVKSLLEDILDKNREIRELRERIHEIEKLLPVPHIVKSGESHYQVAMDFLMTEKGLDQKRAMELVERTALLDTMVPGFKVWNFYTGDAYGTSVTQGDAAVSPNALIRRAKKKLVDARDEAVSQRDKLSDDIKALEVKRTQIIAQLDMLSKEKESLITRVTKLNRQNQDMQETVNSLFYLLDTQGNLKKNKILKGGFLRSTKLQDVSPEHFTLSVDLRTGNQVAISAEQLGVSKIRSVLLYPKFYKKGKDYNITIAPDKQTASVLLLDLAKFKNERVVIAVK